MKKLKQLTSSEVMFIGGETSNVYQHVAGLVFLDTSDRPDFGFEDFRGHMETHIARIPQLRWKLHEVPLGLDLPYWVEDENFDLDNHIRRIGVPSPGDDQALSEVVSHLYCKHLPRDRPLWEFWFIEGLADGKYAFVQKMHHCLADGEGAIQMAGLLWDLEPDPPMVKTNSGDATASAGEVPERWRQSLNSAMGLARMPLRTGREVYAALRQELAGRLSGAEKSRKRPVAPHSCLNTDISADRGFAFRSIPLESVKAIKDCYGVTVNDVVLALVSGGLREYLLARGELPDEALRTSIAISLRTEGDDDFSNRVTVASVTLGTHLADPLARLQAIAEDSALAKEEARQGGKSVMEFMELFPPVVVKALAKLTPAEQIPKLAGVNLVVSNVRGSDKPMYIGGARADVIYPMSIITPGGGLNVTCMSYRDGIHFGFTVEPQMIPDPWLLVEGLERSLAEYRKLIKKGSPRRKKAPAAKSRAKKRTAPTKARTPRRRSK